MIKWIKNKWAEWQYRRRLKKKIKKLAEDDPYIYD